MRSERILRSSGLSRQWDAKALRVSSGSLPIQKTKRVPKIARACLAALSAHLRMFKGQILEFDRMINAWHRPNKARSSTRFQALAPRSLPLWSPASRCCG